MDTKKLAYLYNMNQNDIINHKKYLNFSLEEHCCYYEPEPYIQTGVCEFSKPIEHMLKYYSNVNKFQFLSDAFAHAKQIDGLKVIKYSNDYPEYHIRDQVILQYISNRPKTFILTVWPCSSAYIDQIINFLQTNGVVTVCRELELTYAGAQNLVCSLYNKIILSKTSVERKLKFINSKLLYSKFVSDNKPNKFYTIVFENINNLPISGTGAAFKTQLREFIKSLILRSNPNENVELPDTVHINDFFYESIEYAQTYFHEQTLINLQTKILTNWLDSSFYPSYLRLNAIKNWQIKNLSTLEAQRLILLTGSSFLTTGIRKSGDVDSIFINIGSDLDREKELVNIIYNDFFNEKTKIPFLDSGMPGTIAWKDSWTRSNDEFYNSTIPPINDFSLALNSSNYYYWNGLKIMTFNLTVQFKLCRYIPSDYVDFIVLHELYPEITQIEINLVKDYIWENKPNRSKEKINQLIIKSFDRYLISDKRKINISKYLLK